MDHNRNLQAWKVHEALTSNRLGAEEQAALLEVLNQGRLTLGPQTRSFQSEFGEYIGRDAIAVNSCTSALYLAAQILGIGPDDEVIVTTQTLWVTAWPAAARNAVVRFADIDPMTLTANPESVLARITSKTKAIIVMHFGGCPTDMDPIMEAAKKRGISVIEDCAHAVGGHYKGRPVGTLGDIACFSFGPTKNMTTGEGGMFVTSNPAWRDAAERLRRYVAVGERQNRSPHLIGPYAPSNYYDDWHAQRSFDSDYVGPVLLGHNFRMSEFNAAIGRVQLKKLPMLNQRRKEIAARLDAGLRQIEGVQVQEVAQHLDHVHHLYTFFVDGNRFPGVRDRLVRWLQEVERVEVILRYFPVHLLPEFRARGHQPDECPIAEKVYFTQQVQLPIHDHLEEWQIDHMVDAVSRGMDYAKKGL